MLINNHGWTKVHAYHEKVTYQEDARQWFISHFPRSIDNPAGIFGPMFYSLGIF